MPVNLKRIYDEAASDDGVRVLVDRVWPRGISKAKAQLDHWLKEIGPSSDLRKWFGHDPEKFDEFKKKYKEELADGEQREELQKLKGLTKTHNKDITLLFAAKDEKYNQARVLKEILDRQ
ncbi:Uncharacterized conserved protein YeaO, DUF488 family [Lentibacillus persicus]|uniref:Uncharacterized conserved protein YeaO, DUF488 family n=1 Tax=Lentibacillus persicus TaxID=640948 RepID=A0A1I1XLC8_9BACI|nr:DUF488 family protein [Lentibacillus persicus]SFE08021.1 Uncharacterized conserved protein YeaO, DUF488 family [Lentibacillus persicus]